MVPSRRAPVAGSNDGQFGGWGGIRTLEPLERLPVFKTGAFNHSATHPSPLSKNFLFHTIDQVGAGAARVSVRHRWIRCSQSLSRRSSLRVNTNAPLLQS